MEKLRNTLNKVLNLLAGLSMTVMVVLTTYQVIVRYIFNSPSTWSEELVGYLFGWRHHAGCHHRLWRTRPHEHPRAGGSVQPHHAQGVPHLC